MKKRYTLRFFDPAGHMLPANIYVDADFLRISGISILFYKSGGDDELLCVYPAQYTTVVKIEKHEKNTP